MVVWSSLSTKKAAGDTVETVTIPPVRMVGRIPQGIHTTVDVKIHLLARIMDGKQEIISPYRGVVIHTQGDMLCHFFLEKTMLQGKFGSKVD